MRSSTKIGLATLVLVGGGYLGYNAYASYQVDHTVFADLKPGVVSLLGVDTGRDRALDKVFKITVSNDIAQLVELDKGEELEGEVGSDQAEGANRRRVPIREMLQALEGDADAAGKLVVAMNDNLRKQELPSVEILWDSKDLEKALAGDKALKDKLEADLNVHLDGQPLDKIRPSSLTNGIVVRAYVPVKVLEGEQVTVLQAPIKLKFTPRFVDMVTKHFEEIFNPSKETIMGYYLEEANSLKERPGDRQDVGLALKNLIDPKALEIQYAEGPNEILKGTRVLVTEKLMHGGEVHRHEGPNGKEFADLNIRLKDEGRKRLWQYSRRNPGSQLLLVDANGIAVAAPRITGELANPMVTIRNIQNPKMADGVVEQIQSQK